MIVTLIKVQLVIAIVTVTAIVHRVRHAHIRVLVLPGLWGLEGQEGRRDHVDCRDLRDGKVFRAYVAHREIPARREYLAFRVLPDQQVRRECRVSVERLEPEVQPVPRARRDHREQPALQENQHRLYNLRLSVCSLIQTSNSARRRPLSLISALSKADLQYLMIIAV